MKYIIICLILVSSFAGYTQSNQQDATLVNVSPDDLKITIGEWTGSITYLDYQTNNPFTMSANLIVKQGKKENILVLNNVYPNEPKANNTDHIKVTENGTLLNKETVTLKERKENGQIKIHTKREGKDDNRKALIRHTYHISKAQFVIVKEVQFEKGSDWIKRSEFNYKRKN